MANESRIVLSGMATDLIIGIDVLKGGLKALEEIIVESGDCNELMSQFQPVQWMAASLENNIRKIESEVHELPIHSIGFPRAAE
ncbi:hypothetical protein IVB30_19775 [Bradyrhizobium sp. 200]|uniref:hypothetical protein n=1 Tax=Bradyrhizobium sp. 200 TaxID=2782665 RepID=UPI001FFFFA2E|nr:hypothetical protein [Bradyrhizobium sp. 200]UPJ53353.1 hypothetical protein IVB30_19775 [Bradyrhizobium sp. 200]